MKKILLFLALALAYGQRAESQIPLTKLVKKEVVDSLSKLEIMMNETTPFRRKLTHCFGAN